MSLQDEIMRSECMKLIRTMPEKALSEILEFLKEAGSFYSHHPIIKRDIIEIQTIQARLGKMVIRPEFPISEQEN